jgi:hypothetical protein
MKQPNQGDRMEINRNSPAQQNKDDTNIENKIDSNPKITNNIFNVNMNISIVLFIIVVILLYILWNRGSLPPLTEPQSDRAVPVLSQENTEAENPPKKNLDSTATESTPVFIEETPASSIITPATATLKQKPIAADNSEPEVQAASVNPPISKDATIRGNILVCVPADVIGRQVTIHLWRLSADQKVWEPVGPDEEHNKVSVGRANWDATTGLVKIDGITIDASSWGNAGQPYRLQLWVASQPYISADLFDEIIVHRDQDNDDHRLYCQ